MYSYKYIGDIEVAIMGFGTVKPNEVICTDFIINHPLFVAETEKEVKQGTKLRKVNAKI